MRGGGGNIFYTFLQEKQMIPHEPHCKAVNHMGSIDPMRLENYVLN